MRPIIFAGSSNRPLARKIARLSHITYREIEKVTFSNSEQKVIIRDIVRGRKCYILQSLSCPTDIHLMEMILTIDALKREGAQLITGIIPYMGYARQDKQHVRGECVSAQVVVTMLEAVGLDRCVCVDLHQKKIKLMFSIPCNNIVCTAQFAKGVRAQICGNISDLCDENVVIVAPDWGARDRARSFARSFFSHKNVTIPHIHKVRSKTVPNHSTSYSINADIKGKYVIIIDDIIDSGGTLISGASICKQSGAKNVFAVVTHNDSRQSLYGKIKRSTITNLFTTDTIKYSLYKRSHIVSKISVAGCISQVL